MEEAVGLIASGAEVAEVPTSRHVAAQVGDASGLKTFRGRDT